MFFLSKLACLNWRKSLKCNPLLTKTGLFELTSWFTFVFKTSIFIDLLWFKTFTVFTNTSYKITPFVFLSFMIISIIVSSEVIPNRTIRHSQYKDKNRQNVHEVTFIKQSPILKDHFCLIPKDWLYYYIAKNNFLHHTWIYLFLSRNNIFNILRG